MSPAVSEPLQSDPDVELAGAYATCAAVTRRRARNFYYGLKLTPEPKRSAIYSIYAWMRHGDDVTDDGPNLDDRRRRLAAFKSRTERVLAGETPEADDAMWKAFAHTMSAFPIDPCDIHSMLDGLGEDLDHKGYETDEELERYCQRVASSVGIVCLAVWGLRPGASMEQAREMAEHRGVGFQLTNILRDYAEDFDADRVYLPRDAFTQRRVTPEDLRRWSQPDRCRALVASQAARARRRLTLSADLESLIDVQCAPAMWAMTRIYGRLLEKIEHHPRRIIESRRIRVRSIHKAGIALRAAYMGRRERW